MTPIVRIITRLNIGGPSIQAIELSHRLEAHGFVTRLLHGRLGSAEGDMRYLLDGTSVKATYLPQLQRAVSLGQDAAAVRAIYRVLCAVRPAIVHTHMAKAGALGRAATLLYNRSAGRRQPARMVHTYHGHVLEGYFSPRRSALFVQVERLLGHVTDRIVAISPQIKHELLEVYRIGRDSQYAVVPLGFDLSTFAQIGAAERTRARAALEIADGVPVVTTVGRLTAIKRHDVLLAAARAVVDRHPDAVILIAGDGDLSAELQALTRRLRLAASVRFLGWRRDLDVVYGATDVFALTSRNEGTPVALIEAMAAGVPGVSTDVGGVGDVIADDSLGRRVAEGDSRRVAEAVLELLADPQRTMMGERARQHVLARFGVDRLVDDLARLYRAALAHSGT